MGQLTEEDLASIAWRLQHLGPWTTDRIIIADLLDEVRRLRAMEQEAVDLLCCHAQGQDAGCGCRGATLPELAQASKENVQRLQAELANPRGL